MLFLILPYYRYNCYILFSTHKYPSLFGYCHRFHKLFEKFGLDNGDKILKKHFSDVERRDYKDALVVDQAEPLVDYILSASSAILLSYPDTRRLISCICLLPYVLHTSTPPGFNTLTISSSALLTFLQ